MLKIGEKIIYPSVGVMTLVDIREEKIGGETRKYFVLREDGAPSSSLTFVPCDNERLVSQMRPLLTRDEALLILEKVRSTDADDWIEDSKQRSEQFKRIRESGDRLKMLLMIRSIYKNGEERGKEGKKNYVVDESVLKRAERLVYAEFASVLGMSEGEIAEYIRGLMMD